MPSKKEVLEGWTPDNWRECLRELRKDMKDGEIEHYIWLRKDKAKEHSHLRITIEEIAEKKRR